MAGRDDTSIESRSNPVLGAERQRDILTMIGRGEIISVSGLAERFGVSHETIRRDIRGLQEAGRLRRIRGGAAPALHLDRTARRPVAERLSVDADAKLAAARAALPLFAPDMNVYLGGSSTMLLLAGELARSGRKLTVTTNMLDIATVLSEAGPVTVTLLGGVLDPRTRTTGGPDLMKALECRLFDLAVMGASAIHPEFGVLGPTRAHGILGDLLASRAARSAFVAHAGKFGRRDAYTVRPPAQIGAVATDRRPPEPVVAPLESVGMILLLPNRDVP
ncbi:DeoR/GlpR family DNA-binding transcription regulator [Methylobacterium sp. JK268]